MLISAVLSIAPIIWSRFLIPGVPPPPFLAVFAPRSLSTSGLCAALEAGGEQHATAVSSEAIMGVIHRIAGAAVDADAPLMEAGVDSLGDSRAAQRLQGLVGKSVHLRAHWPLTTQLLGRSQSFLQAMDRPVVVPRAPQPSKVLGDVGESGTVGVAAHCIVLPQGVVGEMLHWGAACGRDLVDEIPSARWT